MRMRKKKNLLPRMERCGAYQIKDPYERKGRWHDLMPEAKEIRVELGCGKGRFTVETAAAEPDVLLIAVEKVPDAMVVAMERAAKAELHNVFFIDIDANQLPEIFDQGEVDRIYVNFCDPWPPKRQAKRRLTHGNFLKLYRKVLKDNGQIHFKTDNDPIQEGLENFNLTQQLRVVRSAQLLFNVFDVVVLLLLVIKMNITNQIHNISNIDSVAFHQLNAEVDIIQNRRNLTVCFLSCIKHKVFTLIVLVFLFGHNESILVKAELDKCL